MKISFILPTYNMEKYLARCIDSVINQDINKSEYEIIIIDDESKDNSLVIAQDYAIENDNIIIHSKKNAGLGAARNTGLEIAKGKYVFFLDTDDYIVENTISEIITTADNNELDILTFISTMTSMDNLNITSTTSFSKEVDITTGEEYITNNSYRNEVWWYIINRSFLEKISLKFDEGQWLEDALFTAKLFSKAKKMAHLPFDIHRYRIRPDSAVRNKSISHFNKMLIDQEKVIYDFSKLIDTISNDKRHLKRLKTRQQSFVFFYIIRFIKSDQSLATLKQKLAKFRRYKAYPMVDFIGDEYNGFKYKFISFVFNSPFLLYTYLIIHRLFAKSVKK